MPVELTSLTDVLSVQPVCCSQGSFFIDNNGWKTSKKRKEQTMPFGFNLMRSQVLYRAAQGPNHKHRMQSC